jgi:tetraacyldisaccharide 4'-kinase
VGDEPALLHAALPDSWLGIGGNRLKSAMALSPLLSKKAVFILDDGFQHRRLRRDLDIACLPAGALQDSLLPAGMLREPLNGMRRARCICLIGSAEEAAGFEDTKRTLALRFPQATIVVMHQAPAGWVHLKTGETRIKLPLIRPAALCGIARPRRFIFLLKKMGISLSAESIFNDHHLYKNHEIDSLARKSGVSGIVTTEKDAFRLQTLKLVSWPDIWYLKIELHFSDARSERHFNRIIDTTLPN